MIERIKQEKLCEVWRTHTKYFISYISFLQVIIKKKIITQLCLNWWGEKCVFVGVWRKQSYLMGPVDKNLPDPVEGLEPRTEKPFWKQQHQQVNFSTNHRFSGHSVGKTDTPHSRVHLFSPQGELLNTDSPKRTPDGPNLGWGSKHPWPEVWDPRA